MHWTVLLASNIEETDKFYYIDSENVNLTLLLNSEIDKLLEIKVNKNVENRVFILPLFNFIKVLKEN